MTTATAPYRTVALPAFNDNYIWLLVNDDTKCCVVVDPGDAAVVLQAINEHQLTLSAILITHHHNDHVGGVSELVTQLNREIPVYGPTIEAQQVVTKPLKQDDVLVLEFIAATFTVLDIPGHTKGHIAFYDKSSLFCGDTLFSVGCGRMFEGTPQQFSQSLDKLAKLLPSTLVYCAHEYTLSNITFAQAVEPDNQELQHYQQLCKTLREHNQATIPTTIGHELKVNPFLRLNVTEVRNKIIQHFQAPQKIKQCESFALLRKWKDDF
ncbi:hydroxyacylglutathione hydrolase [Psychrobium sp. 1_MG-2023]|uniref:hydroxyacylglutathione hydrolase n=1 Tax=Psychrobium sp. 1_MG-2023 TaxID=3062624 RepID=UPI0027329360|nr:hydroxyacylglutathione hydrolase [Psychrobium sp. 1_MG-2023]MDP2560213.1 hydroxyacylglutathione hydrolase [Psychrobium sp. 1_MG-2023]